MELQVPLMKSIGPLITFSYTVGVLIIQNGTVTYFIFDFQSNINLVTVYLEDEREEPW